MADIEHAVEQTYCRAPLAKSFNKTPLVSWIPNINISFSKRFGRDTAFSASTDYQSGRPDAEARRLGCVIDVECKAAFGKFYLREWSSAQRNWCLHNSDSSRTPYYLAVYLAEQRGISGEIYLVPSCVIREAAYKSVDCLSIKEIWSEFCLKRGDNGLYVIKPDLWSK